MSMMKIDITIILKYEYKFMIETFGNRAETIVSQHNHVHELLYSSLKGKNRRHSLMNVQQARPLVKVRSWLWHA